MGKVSHTTTHQGGLPGGRRICLRRATMNTIMSWRARLSNFALGARVVVAGG
eukprot:COSAG04_NODE_3874_length_2458_cov_2.643917_4_plen_51_part_01